MHTLTAALFALTYLVFAIGKVPGTRIGRSTGAFAGAVLMLAIGAITPRQALASIDFSAVILLFAMMIIVAILHEDGFFEWITGHVLERLPERHLLAATVVTSGLLSAFLVNDVVCLFMTPLLLVICRKMRLRPIPYLLALATASNIGSAATITGNPQNMLIGSVSGIHYRDFLAHIGPAAVCGLILDWLVLRVMFCRELEGAPYLPLVGKCGSAPMPEEGAPSGPPSEGAPPCHPPSDGGPFKPAIGLSGAASVPGQASKGAPPFRPLSAKGGPQNSPNSQVVWGVAVMLAVIASMLAGLPPARVAIAAAAILLLVRSRHIRAVYGEIDWSLLVLFAGLFIVIGAAGQSGITGAILDAATRWNMHRVPVFVIVVTALSNIVSNVPAVMLLKNLIPALGDPHRMWLLLAAVSTLAGNLTITGSIANIIVVERARPEARISFGDYLRVGVPITAVTMAIAMLMIGLYPG